jgi:hypothetical protein
MNFRVRRERLIFRGVLWAAILGWAWLAARPALAGEPYQQFLTGLRERGLHDLALDYLETMRDSPLVSEQQKSEMPFDEGRVLTELARAERDTAAKSKLLDRARDRFNEFIKSNPSNPLAPKAEIELGEVLVVRAHDLYDQAQRPSNLKKKESLLADSRKILEQAKGVFEGAEAKMIEEAKKYPLHTKKNEAHLAKARTQAVAEAVRAQLYTAGIPFELAKTYPEASEERKKLLQESADKYEKLYTKNRAKLAGLISRMKSGQCYQELGDTKRALGMYEDVFNAGDEEPVARDLKTETLVYALRCWVSDNEKAYEIAADRGEKWLERATAAQERSPHGLMIHYYVGLAHQRLADSLESKEDEARKKTELNLARKNLAFVAKNPGSYRDEAKVLYAKLPGADGDIENKEPTTFAEARDYGREMLDRVQEKQTQIAQAGLMRDEASLPKYKTELEQLRKQTLGYLRKAIELRDDNTPIDDINTVRQLQAVLDFQIGHYYESAVLAEFVARHYSTSPVGRSCAAIAMAAYQANARKPFGEQKDFDKQKMIEVAELITRTWPDQKEAADAWSVLMHAALIDGDLKQAREYLAKIPETSPRRGDSELRLGQELWRSYTIASRKPDDERPPQAELDDMAATARQTLDEGVKRMSAALDTEGGEVNATLAGAALSLANIYLEAGQAPLAIELLDNPKIGPVTLAKANHPATQSQGGRFNYRIEAYKLALRAAVATEDLERAETVMGELEKLSSESGDADAAGQLTRIYVALGRELGEQVERLRQENKTEELAKVSKGFQAFLERISARDKGVTFSSLNWVAETFLSLGSGYDEAGKELPAEAKAYYQKAYETDEKILAALAADKSFGPAGGELAVKLRMARTRRHMRDFKQARDLLVQVLKEKPNILEIQVEAALNYQEWGREKPEYYQTAIKGAGKRPKQTDKLIWGWSLISRRTQAAKDKRQQDIFYEAIYNQAKCDLLFAKQQQGAEKAKALGAAEKAVLYVYRVRPELGGAEWRRKFDDLLKHVQKDQGKKAVGLPADVAKPAGSAAPSTAAAGSAKAQAVGQAK